MDCRLTLASFLVSSCRLVPMITSHVMSVVCSHHRAALVVHGKGEHKHDEMWLLICPQVVEDWNYWIVLTCGMPARSWVVGSIVQWWGWCGYWNLKNMSPPDELAAIDEDSRSTTS